MKMCNKPGAQGLTSTVCAACFQFKGAILNFSCVLPYCVKSLVALTQPLLP